MKPLHKIRGAAIALALLCYAVSGQSAFATDCSAWPQFKTTEPALAPLSVTMTDLQNVLNAGVAAEGMIFEFKSVGRDIWIDVTYAPAESATLAGLRNAFMAFRLISDDFEHFVFSENGAGLFKIGEPFAREIGCQFIWGREGGQNPIYLLRLFYRNLRDFESGALAVDGFNGSLLGDTSRALQFNNEVFVPKWLFSAIQ